WKSRTQRGGGTGLRKPGLRVLERHQTDRAIHVANPRRGVRSPESRELRESVDDDYGTWAVRRNSDNDFRFDHGWHAVPSRRFRHLAAVAAFDALEFLNDKAFAGQRRPGFLGAFFVEKAFSPARGSF